MTTARTTHVDRSGYFVVTVVYWAFMLTDGALRMLVLLHFHSLGYSPLLLAYLFLVYELMGVGTNLLAGWLGTRYGLNMLLLGGVCLQIFALLVLSALNPEWTVLASVLFVMLVQGLSGIAKDLTKTGAKSAVKKLTPNAENGTLFEWVAVLTGSKNAIKGLGFFAGAALLATLGFKASLLSLVMVLVAALLLVATRRNAALGEFRSGVKFRELLSTSRAINTLAAARFVLFGARDTWFVVAVPLFLYNAISSSAVDQRAFFLVGGFLALWVVGYGVVQALTPRWLRADKLTVLDTVTAARRWTGLLLLVISLLTLVSYSLNSHNEVLVPAIIGGLLLFGIVFALNSSLHSYLILALTSQTRATMDVGFYYMANAAGRFIGTLLSGLCFQLGGLTLSLAGAAIMIAISFGCLSRLRGLLCSVPNKKAT